MSNVKVTEFAKVSFFLQCSKMQLITFQNFHIQTCFSQFLWFFSLKCWFKGQMMSKIHLSLPNAYKLMCFDRNVNGNRDVKFLECDKWSLHWYENLTLPKWKLKIFLIFWWTQSRNSLLCNPVEYCQSNNDQQSIGQKSISNFQCAQRKTMAWLATFLKLPEQNLVHKR